MCVLSILLGLVIFVAVEGTCTFYKRSRSLYFKYYPSIESRAGVNSFHSFQFRSNSAPIPLQFRSNSAPILLQFRSNSAPIPLQFCSNSAPIPFDSIPILIPFFSIPFFKFQFQFLFNSTRKFNRLMHIQCIIFVISYSTSKQTALFTVLFESRWYITTEIDHRFVFSIAK